MRTWSLLALSALIFSCTTLSKESALPTALNYENKTFKVTSSDDCEKEKDCAIFEITYPIFSGMDSNAAAALQREVELSFSMGDPEADEKTIQQIANEFIANYQEFTQELPDLSQGWYYHGEARVNMLMDTLISLSLEEEYYTGGAHGGNGKYFINFNPKTGKTLKLKNFFNNGFEDELTRIGEEIFRKERELEDTATYQFNGFEFRDNRFHLNDNFGLTTQGILFYFNNYEIAPYAAGPTEIFIPYEKLKDWLKYKPVL